MSEYTWFKDYKSFLTFNKDKYGKATLFETQYAKIGLNCLEPGQEFDRHAHIEQNRCYIVLEGKGMVSIGTEEKEVAPGVVFYVPEGLVHVIRNTGSERMVVFVGIFPPNAD